MKFKSDYLLVTLLAVIIFGAKFFLPRLEMLTIFADDFFYYLKIANNIAETGESTFNGIVTTNGYHPLWQYILSGLYFLFGELGTIISVTLIQILSSLVSYHYLKKIFNKYLPKGQLIVPSILIFLQIVLIMKGGMEVILTIPLMIFSIYLLFSQSKNYLLFGVVLCLMTLSRLDSFIFAIFISIYLLTNRPEKVKIIILFALAFIPLYIYLGSNLFYFGHLMPVSGAAKQLKTTMIPELHTFTSIFTTFYPGRVITGMIPFLILIFNLFAIPLTKDRKFTFFLIFPIFLLILNSILSGWNLWAWYFYFFIPSTIYFFINYTKVSEILVKFKFVILILCTAWIIFNSYRQMTHRSNMSLRAEEAYHFFKERSGIVAYGDGAGTAAYLIENPVVQLEGLVMDHNYLDEIKNGDLINILKKYNVEYYVSITSIKKDSIWLLTEPWDHHKNIINMKRQTKVDPIYNGGDGWLIFRVWDAKSLINEASVKN